MVQNDHFDLLIEEATPELYDLNAFRVLGLPVDSTSREIKRHLEKSEMRLKFSIDSEPRDVKERKDNTQADLDRMREAAHRLNDPELRFIDEFFWYWPLKLNGSDQDDAIQAVLNNETDLAINIWNSSKNTQSENHIAVHNLAIHFHYVALKSIQKENLSTRSIEERKQLWDKAFSFWRDLLEFEAFWRRVSKRIKNFDDPRLTTDVTQKIRKSLPTALLLINSRLATSYALDGENRSAGISNFYLTESGFKDSIQIDAKIIALKSVQESLKTITNSTIREAEDDLIHANEYLLDFINGETLERSLVAVDTLLPIDHPTRVGIHDDIAEKIRGCLFSFSQKTELWAKARYIAEKAKQIAESNEQKQRYDDLIERFRDYENSEFTWRVEGYYDINKVLVDKLEEARALFKLEKFDQAIGVIFNLFESKPSLIGRKEEEIIYKPLAMCLTIRALARLDKIQEKSKKLPPTLAKASTAFFSPGGLFLYGSCRVCGKDLSGRYYTFQVRGTDVQLCKRCGRKVNSELKNRQRNTQDEVRKSARDLLLAEKLDPDNETIKDRVKDVRQIAKSVEIRMPSALNLPNRKTHATPIFKDKPKKREPSEEKRPTTGGKRQKGKKRPSLAVLAVLGLIVACVITLSLDDSFSDPPNSSYSPSNTDPPKATFTTRPTKEPTREPTINPYQLPYRESFNAGTRDWYTGSESNGTIEIDEGKYIVSVVKDRGLSGTNGAVFSNASINIDTYYMSGQDIDQSGLSICFRCNQNRGYELIVFGDGGYGVVKSDGENWRELVPFRYHVDVHNYWQQPNKIKIIMDYSDFEIYCNGSKVAEFSDSSYRSGSIYLGGFASPTDEVTIGFDNLAIEE
jgi:hypothetical protein